MEKRCGGRTTGLLSLPLSLPICLSLLLSLTSVPLLLIHCSVFFDALLPTPERL